MVQYTGYNDRVQVLLLYHSYLSLFCSVITDVGEG